ncbi:TetR/AcrR family transcriptional regulator [Actinomarinicola tropica]|uniref:TetR/AcrR family transcriptional regulator n=1 Tax=Actinomarinicola tropica TaxID=2789776 RepID=UPI0018980E8B|nr:TetR/AcrR family transcriptional regulator [Actinomarinicola tropica]
MPDDTSPAAPVDDGVDDPVRERLIDAAAEVFARDGYDGARIQDIVRSAGLTTGAVYGRFRGKGELLHEAVVTRAVPQGPVSPAGLGQMSEVVRGSAHQIAGPLHEREALLLETYVAARREPDVAGAIHDANDRWLTAMAPLVEAALSDGTIDEGVDPAAVLFLVRILRLGLLVHRGSGLPGPSQDGWDELMSRVVASFGAEGPGEADRDTTDTTT